jgi:hypothetical protein
MRYSNPLLSSVAFFGLVFSASAQELSPVLPEKKIEGTPLKTKGAFKFGSNFSYGPSSSFDLGTKEEFGLNWGRHQLENTGEIYSYYWVPGDGEPKQRLKDKRGLGLKYLLQVYGGWSPFIGYKYTQESVVQNGKERVTSSQNSDLGVRYKSALASNLWLTLESGYRHSYRRNTGQASSTVPSLRNYASLYFSDAGLNAGLWATHLAPLEEMSNYGIDFGPDINYTLWGTSFYLGFQASANYVPKLAYDGDTHFKIWSGSFYGGMKL